MEAGVLQTWINLIDRLATNWANALLFARLNSKNWTIEYPRSQGSSCIITGKLRINRQWVEVKLVYNQGNKLLTIQATKLAKNRSAYLIALKLDFHLSDSSSSLTKCTLSTLRPEVIAPDLIQETLYPLVN